jgi:cell division protein FtsW (lipid II flippase)
MGVTFTSAVERRELTRASTLQYLSTSELSLIAVSVLSVLMLVLTCLGRFGALASAEPDVRGALVNLNGAVNPARLDLALTPILETAADRKLAARELSTFLGQEGGTRRVLPNVGALARVRIPAAAIDAAPSAVAYRERLRTERERAASASLSPPTSVSLFTAGELAAIKPALIVRDRAAFFRSLLLWATLYVAAFHAVSLLWRSRRIRGDRVLLSAAHLLTAIGFVAMVGRPDPLRDLLLFARYAQGIIAGLAVAAAASLIQMRTAPLRQFSYLPLIGAVLLSCALVLFGEGPAGSRARVNLGPVQPIEMIRLLLAFFLAGYFASRWELLRAVRAETLRGVPLPKWLNVPHLAYALPVLLGVAAALSLFLTTYAIARGTVGLAIVGALLLGAGFYLGYQLEISSTLADRVRMWQAPWDNAARGGDQVAQAVWAMAAGGPFGSGAGLGDTRYLPAGHTDLVLAAVAEDLGMVGLLVIAAVYAAIFRRAVATAREASSDYAFFLAVVLALFLTVPVLLMAAGVMGLVPLTGVVTPFLSFGGSAMVANFAALGLLAAIRSDSTPTPDLGVFRMPLRWTGAIMSVAGLAVVFTAVGIQVLHADEYLVRPHLGMQADGTRRFQYNPRVIDAARRIPRGTILDRAGLPLATDDDELLRRSAAAFQRAGISLASVCPDSLERCYPLSGRAFHLVGDARSRLNWSAGNTSFVERDSEAKLRGFDDRATLLRVTGVDGDTVALRRDYRDLVPLVRHRYDLDHPAAKAVLARPREIRLTIDARLQVRVAGILAEYARRFESGHAAAVVLDVGTGDLLASVSYPYPEDSSTLLRRADGTPREDLLDRARYGLYPPGSTFKMLTAAAALRRDPAASRRTFTCSRLSDGRVGAKVAGWGRPVRDDLLDHEPHGTISMHDALVVSCNAYFAQLAVSLGPEVLRDMAARADVSLSRGDDPARARDTLPQIGYGQGEVVATPLRMARIAAAIAAGGGIRDVRVDKDTPARPPEPLVTPDAARLLASYLRDAVLRGTGRSLKSHQIAIAGKTGTAEISEAPSHAWFVGFAPYGQSTRRIAVAVIIENAGYGGTAAAPAAGEIVSAAAAVGLLE